jgi:hypothetical protein
MYELFVEHGQEQNDPVTPSEKNISQGILHRV